ncbi:NADH-quinone oxidoreductase E subunit [Jatrophihabitans sp. GAS493]|uniref:NADH-quinone oxidoreductase subunit NuoE n=1 Tax=Jatrophihabitans sp. GAS493 TaxID=1907575 RepID=UPI000BC08A0B|nr:NADH-quinone oxidoreductase subunit NuoE [Jatrophihabitans sp. GAS493]SOD72319.1 NADH-quinone oxidoreductase E subunit [Jatrophihabitans sp. GAS493]
MSSFEGQPTNFRTSVMSIDRPGDASVFSDQVRADAQEIIARYPAGQSRSALLPMLHLVQSEQGYITPDGIAFCADTLDITKAQVAAVATFYTMYKRKPTGEYLVSVCTNTLCGLLGGDDIYAALSEYLGVGMNGTTDDGKITLEHAECLAGCDYAPVVTVNYEFFDNQTVDSADALVKKLQNGDRPLPTRGAPLCSFREIERQIAGFLDPRPEAIEAEGTGLPTEAGVKLAIARGETAPSYAAATSKPAEAPKAEAPKTEEPKTEEPKVEEPTPEPAAAEVTDVTSANDAPLETVESDPEADDSQPAAVPETAEVSTDSASTDTAPTDSAPSDDEQAKLLSQMPGLESAPETPAAPRRTARARVRKPASEPQSDQLSFGDEKDGA